MAAGFGEVETKAQARPRGGLRPVKGRKRWVVTGLSLQLIGVGGPAAYLVSKAHHEGIGGHITAATIELAWHNEMHVKSGLVLFVAGAIIFAAGSVFMARPYVHHWATLLIAIPLAAIAGMLVLGLIALLVSAALAIGTDGPGDFGGGGRSRRRSRRRRSG